MTTITEVDDRDALAVKIRHWYWGYVRAVGAIGPDADDPEEQYHILYDGGADKWGRTRQPIWPELAQWAIEPTSTSSPCCATFASPGNSPWPPL